LLLLLLLLQEPLLAAGRLLDFEQRRPGAAQAVLALLGAEYGQQVRLGQLATTRSAWQQPHAAHVAPPACTSQYASCVAIWLGLSEAVLPCCASA
jgi:hypothetical protein